ncbi:sensor histidine kinase [Tunicatimonas pelagia]|uniref:sensor histidine kinase n=1 Tax=Tunicatimonas pelagia TaxID=931531 RepID=UPI002666E022|nr:sensor histidine kinase [Tunicatimonas pelagia]WKN42236.1 sensor histidine kinase [Tunicatimonas pelagia]
MNTQFIKLDKREAWFHIAFWLLVMVSAISAWSNNMDSTHITFRGISLVLTFILPMYINIFVLIPRFFKRDKWLTYALCLVVLLIVAKVLHTVLLLAPWMINDWASLNFSSEFSHWMFREFNSFDKFVFSQLPWIIYISFAYRFVKDWFVNEQVKSRLISEKLSVELALLKAQVSPHFLFNTLNNIYAVALDERAVSTADNISKLGTLMRYSLHDTQADFIALNKELDYLERYIELQRMRLTEDQQLNVDLDLKNGKIGSLSIAPMILLPFIENAFKYGVSTTHASQINISIQLIEKRLVMEVENAVQRTGQSKVGGLGLENVKNRLTLIYPNRHKLTCGLNDGKYLVHLELNLT